MNSSVSTIQPNMTSGLGNMNSYSQNLYRNISENNVRQIIAIKSFINLNENWNSYNANVTSQIAITKAISFVKYLSDRGIEVYFVAPTVDGDVMVELYKDQANLEFIFSKIAYDDKVIASYKGNFSSENAINDTTVSSYLKWLICPNGNCPNI